MNIDNYLKEKLQSIVNNSKKINNNSEITNELFTILSSNDVNSINNVNNMIGGAGAQNPTPLNPNAKPFTPAPVPAPSAKPLNPNAQPFTPAPVSTPLNPNAQPFTPAPSTKPLNPNAQPFTPAPVSTPSTPQRGQPTPLITPGAPIKAPAPVSAPSTPQRGQPGPLQLPISGQSTPSTPSGQSTPSTPSSTIGAAGGAPSTPIAQVIVDNVIKNSDEINDKIQSLKVKIADVITSAGNITTLKTAQLNANLGKVLGFNKNDIINGLQAELTPQSSTFNIPEYETHVNEIKSTIEEINNIINKK